MIDSKQVLKTRVNNLIDTLLSDWNMVFMQRYFEGLKPAVKNKEDGFLGLCTRCFALPQMITRAFGKSFRCRGYQTKCIYHYLTYIFTVIFWKI
jgi:hypothetical protein